MAARVETDEDSESNKGSMWVLDQKLDQPMDEEAGRLRNMYREKRLGIHLSSYSPSIDIRDDLWSLSIVLFGLENFLLYYFCGLHSRVLELYTETWGRLPCMFSTIHFLGESKDPEDVIGALSLIIYSLTLVPLLKYVFVVCKANDNGQGNLIFDYVLH
ncbi:hypothetical protein Patl1_12263 [Pistacia atlantica]|uniref:Uncharacterized protein n=1 Tax=Pistacia atlantica TaxID=434234 RepID=A0ACC1A8F2_9ROSI|nr:hypothetical protein Patl1_12263 [Pistacia atlantica]